MKQLTLCAVFFILILPAGARAAAKDRQHVDCLKERFGLCSEIDVGWKGLEGAGEFLERNDHKGCEREIIAYFLSRESPYRLDLWGFRSDTRVEADSILANSYRFWIYERVTLPADLTWRENPLNSRNWIYYLFSFEFLGILNDAYARTGDRRYLDRGRELILDFVHDNIDPNNLKGKDLSWYDHTTANRLLALLDFWGLLEPGTDADGAFTSLFLDLIWRHAHFLTDNRNYSSNGNHGIFSAAAMLRLSLVFPEFTEAPEWRLWALERIEAQLADNVSADGVHHEFSPWYQIWLAGVLEQVRLDCVSNGIELPDSTVETIGLMLDAIPHFYHPDGTISLLGDSDAYTSEPYQNLALSRVPAYRYIRSGGRSGRRPHGSTRAFTDARIYIMRNGWGKARPLPFETCLIANLSGYAKHHDHYDSMDFEFSALGQKWITDCGRWAYEHGAGKRKFLVSPMAHNIVVPHCFVPHDVPKRPAKSKVQKIEEGTQERFSRSEADPSSKPRIPTLMSVIIADYIVSASLDDSAAVQAVFDTIGAIRDIDTQIAACELLLSRNPRGFTDKLKLLLAYGFGDGKGDYDAAIFYLREIVQSGSDTAAQKVAGELLEIYEKQQRENIRLETAPDQIETVEKEKEKRGQLIVVAPNRKKTPTVFHWLSNRDYDYLEGGVSYAGGLHWSRAFLFIKPRCLLIIDAMQGKKGYKARQLFHAPPSVNITRAAGRYILSNHDSLRCIVETLFNGPIEDYRIIKGKNNVPLQGWYSDMFFSIEKAPVIENFVDLQRPMTYLATIIIPLGEYDPGRCEVRLHDTADWNESGPSPLHIEILEPGRRTTVTCMPSSKLFGKKDGIERDPDITVKRRRR